MSTDSPATKEKKQLLKNQIEKTAERFNIPPHIQEKWRKENRISTVYSGDIVSDSEYESLKKIASLKMLKKTALSNPQTLYAITYGRPTCARGVYETFFSEVVNIIGLVDSGQFKEANRFLNLAVMRAEFGYTDYPRAAKVLRELLIINK